MISRNAHSSPNRCIQRGAWRFEPARKSNAAPTPNVTTASDRGARASTAPASDIRARRTTAGRRTRGRRAPPSRPRRGERAERRTESVAHLEGRPSPRHDASERLERRLVAAVEPDWDASGRGRGEEAGRQLGTAHAGGIVDAQQRQAPDERHAVGCDEVAPVHHLAERRIVVGLHHVVDGRHPDHARIALLRPRDDASHRVAVPAGRRRACRGQNERAAAPQAVRAACPARRLHGIHDLPRPLRPSTTATVRRMT